MEKVKIFIFGIGMAGKTSIVNVLITHKIPTNIHATLAMDKHSYKLEDVDYVIWEASGQQKLRSTWNNGFLNAKILVYIVDVSDRERIKESKDVFTQFLGEIEKLTTPLIICFHKIDLISDNSNIDYAKQMFGMNQLCKKKNIYFLETTIIKPETIAILNFLFGLLIKGNNSETVRKFCNE